MLITINFSQHSQTMIYAIKRREILHNSSHTAHKKGKTTRILYKIYVVYFSKTKGKSTVKGGGSDLFGADEEEDDEDLFSITTKPAKKVCYFLITQWSILIQQKGS